MRSAKIIPLAGHEDMCAECGLTGQCLSKDADCADDLHAFEIPATPRVLRRGEHLFRTGQPFESVLVLRSGAVKTYMISLSGKEQVVGFHLPGDLLGIDSIESSEHMCNAVALDTCSFCTLPFDKLMRLCARSRTIQRRLFNRISRTVLHGESMLLTLGQKSAEQRVAAFLLRLIRRQAERGYSASEINLPMARADLASYLALAVETASRVLTRLQEAGVLTVRRSRVQVLDLEALGQAAEERIDDLRDSHYQSQVR